MRSGACADQKARSGARAEKRKLAVESGVWPVFRFDPRRALRGEAPLVLEGGKARRSEREYLQNETTMHRVGRARRRKSLLIAGSRAIAASDALLNAILAMSQRA